VLRRRTRVWVAGGLFLLIAGGHSGAATATERMVDSAPLGDGLNLAYYVSAPSGAAISKILIAIHGYSRDANRTFDAAAAAARQTSAVLIVAPIFQVPTPEAAKCQFPGVPGASPGDALWHCGNWASGSQASNGAITSFAAMDRLEAVLLSRYPGAGAITLAGFSAGGQYVQHYIGFARPPGGVQSRYVIADPSEFVYFDGWRPQAASVACPGYNDWKYGTENLPPSLGRGGEEARAIYSGAAVDYLEGALDTGTGAGTSYRLLEKNCSAELEGPYRLERGEAYAAYDAERLAHGAHRLTIVPGCAHSVTCVFPSAAAVRVLFPSDAPTK
jgi:hypothetical protein